MYEEKLWGNYSLFSDGLVITSDEHIEGLYAP